jgi:hypothetical protein
MPAITDWQPEQDLSQDSREINLPIRIVEERGRGVFIKKCSELQHLLDHQAQDGQPVKLGLSVKDNERTCESWFTIVIPAAQILDEYEHTMMSFLQDRIPGNSEGNQRVNRNLL